MSSDVFKVVCNEARFDFWLSYRLVGWLPHLSYFSFGRFGEQAKR